MSFQSELDGVRFNEATPENVFLKMAKRTETIFSMRKDELLRVLECDNPGQQQAYSHTVEQWFRTHEIIERPVWMQFLHTMWLERGQQWITELLQHLWLAMSGEKTMDTTMDTAEIFNRIASLSGSLFVMKTDRLLQAYGDEERSIFLDLETQRAGEVTREVRQFSLLLSHRENCD